VAEYASGHPEETRVTFLDERVWAGVPMAPAGYEALTGGLAAVIVPTFFLAGSLDTTSPMASQVMPLFDGLGSQEKVVAEIHTAGHLAFSNACDMLPTNDECAEPFIDVLEGHQLIKTAIAAFLGDQRGIDGMESFLPAEDERVTWLSE
jgi:predicted dienelactone hydrolase